MKLARTLALLATLATASLGTTTTTAAAPGITDDRILIGQSAPLSGPAQALGTEMRAGAQLYFDMVNAQGGVNGRKIELLTLDDGYEPARTTENTRKLLNETQVFALFGYVGTPTSAAALPLVTEAQVPFIAAYTGAELLRTPHHPQVFNIRASYFDETEHIVNQLVTTGVRNIAVFYQNDAYGKAGLEGVERAMSRRNLKVSATATVERNTTDVAAAAKSLLAVKPDAIIQISAYKSCAALIREMKKAGSASQFYNVSFVGSQALADELGDDGVGVVISQVVPFPWSGTDSVVRQYQQLAQKAGIERYSFTALEGFIAAKVLVEGLRRSGKAPTRNDLVTALESMQNYDAGGFRVNFAPDSHNGSNFVELTILSRNGRFVR